MSLQLGKERLYPNSKNSASRNIKTSVDLMPRKSDYWTNQQGKKSQKIQDTESKRFGNFGSAS